MLKLYLSTNLAHFQAREDFPTLTRLHSRIFILSPIASSFANNCRIPSLPQERPLCSILRATRDESPDWRLDVFLSRAFDLRTMTTGGELVRLSLALTLAFRLPIALLLRPVLLESRTQQRDHHANR